MPAKNVAVFGIFSSTASVDATTQALVTAGFSADGISVLLPESAGGTKQIGFEKTTKAPDGTAAGVTTGGIVGGALGLLAGVGLLAIPGVGPFIAAGPILSAFAGIGVGGTVGGIAGALIGLGISEFEAKRYEGHLANGGILLSVHCDTTDDVLQATEIVENAGGKDVASAGEEMIETREGHSSIDDDDESLT